MESLPPFNKFRLLYLDIRYASIKFIVIVIAESFENLLMDAHSPII